MGINIETLRLKFRNKIYIPLTRKSRRKKLQNEQFTIISNNCWGGTVYESYGIKKMSPTVGTFIMPKDYLKFVTNIQYYLAQPLDFIDPDDSKWKKELEKKSNWKTYLIGRIGDIELHMLHYHDEDVARSKWESRIKRINWDKIIYKFNDQNGATIEDIEGFVKLQEKHKICFVAQKEMLVSENVIYIKQPGDLSGGVKASREPFGKNKYIDITDYINRL